MSTKIKDLPPDIREIACKRHKQYHQNMSTDAEIPELELEKAFIWSRTPEGDKYWRDLCYSNKEYIPFDNEVLIFN